MCICTHILYTHAHLFTYKTSTTHTHRERYIYTGHITKLYLTYQVLVLSSPL